MFESLIRPKSVFEGGRGWLGKRRAGGERGVKKGWGQMKKDCGVAGAGVSQLN